MANLSIKSPTESIPATKQASGGVYNGDPVGEKRTSGSGPKEKTFDTPRPGSAKDLTMKTPTADPGNRKSGY